jgi:hypothetical protein
MGAKKIEFKRTDGCIQFFGICVPLREIVILNGDQGFARQGLALKAKPDPFGMLRAGSSVAKAPSG